MQMLSQQACQRAINQAARKDRQQVPASAGDCALAHILLVQMPPCLALMRCQTLLSRCVCGAQLN